ncbi:hypothetical protein EMIT093MI4_10631 [Pseudomonas sp. IT-93MI4]
MSVAYFSFIGCRYCFFSPMAELAIDNAIVIPAFTLRISLVSSSRSLLRSAIRCAAMAPANAPANAPTNDVVNEEFEKDFIVSQVERLNRLSIKGEMWFFMVVISVCNLSIGRECLLSVGSKLWCFFCHVFL